MSKNQITTTSRNPYYSPLSKIFDGFWDDDYGYGIKNGTYEVNVAGYSKNEVTVEQEGNLVLVEADNEKRGKRYHRFTISDIQQVDEVKYNNGLLEIEIGSIPEKTKKIKIS